MITPDSTGDDVLACLIYYYKSVRYEDLPDFVEIFQKATCLLSSNCYAKIDPSNFFPPKYWFTFFVHPNDLRFAQSHQFREECINTLLAFIHDDVEIDIQVKLALPNQERTIGLNNCFFKRETTIVHDELRFRSKGEVAIYDELKRRNVLFFPNPAAVLGTTGQEFGATAEKREPDFLICCNGKWGILEINGEDFHCGIIKTTKDHERARRFKQYGVFFIEAYDLDRCKKDAVGVVDEFLLLLAKHK